MYIYQSNRLVKLEGLDHLVNLEELYVSHNGLEVIEGLDNLVTTYVHLFTYQKHLTT